MINLSVLQKPLIALAQTAAAAVLECYQHRQALDVRLKSDNSPQTRADLVAHAILTTALQQLAPDVPILSEEGSPSDWETRKTWDTYWLLDPLDGTLPFIAGIDEFTVNIALIHNHIPIFGCVVQPVTRECYYASSGHGAYKLTVHGKEEKLAVRSWQPGQTNILASHGANKQKLRKYFKHLGVNAVHKLSSSWKFCLLAEGKYDVSPRLGNTSEWDTAAAHCILKEAGGDIFDLSGESLRYNTKASLLNPHFIALGDVVSLHKKIFS